MKKIILPTLLLISVMAFGQVGINTKTPQATLHVNGDLQVGKSFHTGGDDKTAGDAGRTGNFLSSQGPGKPPVWKSSVELDVPLFVASARRLTYTGTIHPANNSIILSFPTDAASKFYTNSDYISYNTTTNRFTVLKSGFYNITVFVRYATGDNGIGSTTTLINSSTGVLQTLTNNYGNANTLTQNQNVDVNLNTTVYITANTTVWLQGAYTRNFTMPQASISFMYIGL